MAHLPGTAQLRRARLNRQSHAEPMTGISNNPPVLYEQVGAVAFVTLNRPAALNAINPALWQALDEAMERVRDDTSVRVAILRGAGEKAFCAGADLKWRAENADRLRTEPTRNNRARFVMPDFDLWKPVIAAVHGYALGGGFEIAMACDMIIASEDAVFGYPEPRRGLVADGTAIHRLVRELPRKQANEILLTGKMFSATEGERLGFVNRVVPKAELKAAAQEVASEMLASSPQALKATKQMVRLGAEMTFQQAFETEFPEFRRLKESPDFSEGARAFTEKRKPRWEDT